RKSPLLCSLWENHIQRKNFFLSIIEMDPDRSVTQDDAEESVVKRNATCV
ncbi:unnamed protein product, partial [Arabidopsis halleri]